MAGVTSTPQNEGIAKVARAMMGARNWLNALRFGQYGDSLVEPEPQSAQMDIGSALIGRAPEEFNEWSYGNSPFKDKPVSGVSDLLPQLQERRAGQVLDAAMLAPVPNAAKMSAVVGAMKPKGGAWLPKTLEQISRAINKPPLSVTGEELAVRTQESERMAKNWLNRYAGTSEDPIKDVEIPLDVEEYGQYVTRPTRIEDVTDSAFSKVPESWFYDNPAQLRRTSGNADPTWRAPDPLPGAPEYREGAKFVPDEFGLPNLRHGEDVYGATGAQSGDASFSDLLDHLGHVGDTLREVPTQDLKRWDLVRAVRETARRDKEAESNRLKASFASSQDLPVHKDYGNGFKWVEIGVPEKLTPEQMKHIRDTGEQPHNPKGWYRDETLGPRYLALDHQDQPIQNSYTGQYAGGDTPEDAWAAGHGAQEGNIMGHCVGGYCGTGQTSRIFSLRDKNGESHVTIEVSPQNKGLSGDRLIEAGREDMWRDFQAARAHSSGGTDLHSFVRQHDPSLFDQLMNEVSIEQIKGKQNQKPKGDYIPYVQDFVKSGKWRDVGDAHHADLWPVGRQYLTRDEMRKLAVEKGMNPQAVAAMSDSQLQLRLEGFDMGIKE